MSADTINNLVARNIPKGSLPQSQNAQPVDRQTDAVQNGKNVPPVEVESKSPDLEQLMEAVSKLNDHLQNVQRDLHFSIDDASGQTVVRVVNSETEEVIRQIPSEEVLRISQTIKEQMDNLPGLIFESSA